MQITVELEVWFRGAGGSVKSSPLLLEGSVEAATTHPGRPPAKRQHLYHSSINNHAASSLAMILLKDEASPRASVTKTLTRSL